MLDPYQVLKVGTDVDDATVHSAYINAIKVCPPDRDPQQFETIRKAYEAIRTRKARLARDLFDTNPPTPMEILDRVAPIQPLGKVSSTSSFAGGEHPTTLDSRRPTLDMFCKLLREIS